MPKNFEANKSITKDIAQQFVNLVTAENINMEDLQEVYQACKSLSYVGLKRLTSICLMKGDYEEYLHLKRYWKIYAQRFEIKIGEKWTKM